MRRWDHCSRPWLVVGRRVGRWLGRQLSWQATLSQHPAALRMRLPATPRVPAAQGIVRMDQPCQELWRSLATASRKMLPAHMCDPADELASCSVLSSEHTCLPESATTWVRAVFGFSVEIIGLIVSMRQDSVALEPVVEQT